METSQKNEVEDGGAKDDALIHMRVSKERKGAWVLASRREGKKLTDWIIERVERDSDTQKPL